ncbi:MAG: ADP-ribosylation factor-like protein [Candidatus Hodarchaeales archaeon]|jgi:signal recognition particle receptor subunit beta
MSDSLKVKHGEQGIKIVFFGPTMSGKTTILSIFHAIKKKEDPEKTYQFLKLEDKATERTIGFDHAVFGLGSTGFKYHLFTVAGQDRFAAMRRVVSQGLHGLIMVINSERSEWDANKRSLTELFQLFGAKLKDGSMPIQILLNKMDLPEIERINSYDAAKLLVETGIRDNIPAAQVDVLELSCLNALADLRKMLQEGNFDPKRRPITVQRIIQPIQHVIRNVLVQEMKKQQS